MTYIYIVKVYFMVLFQTTKTIFFIPQNAHYMVVCPARFSLTIFGNSLAAYIRDTEGKGFWMGRTIDTS